MRAAADNYQPPLPLGDDCMDAGGRATQDAKAERWGEGKPCNAALKPLPPGPSPINGRGEQSPTDLRASA
jgi:hypothetical protein